MYPVDRATVSDVFCILSEPMIGQACLRTSGGIVSHALRLTKTHFDPVLLGLIASISFLSEQFPASVHEVLVDVLAFFVERRR